MKYLIACLVVFGLSIQASAEADFEARKAEKLSAIDKRIASLKEHKACVSAAKDQEAVKACQQKIKGTHAENKQKHLDKKIKNLEDKKKKLKEKSGK